jgi:hypothetical protein
VYSELSCAAKPYADALIDCVCTYCASQCVDMTTCVAEWQANTVDVVCQTCGQSASQNECLGPAQACSAN